MTTALKRTPLRLKAALAAKGLTFGRFARQVNFSQKTIYSWMQGYRQPSLETVIQLCRVLGVTPNDLLDLNYDQPVSP